MSDILGIVILGRVSLEVATELTQALFQELWPSSQSARHCSRGWQQQGKCFSLWGCPFQSLANGWSKSKRRSGNTRQDATRLGG